MLTKSITHFPLKINSKLPTIFIRALRKSIFLRKIFGVNELNPSILEDCVQNDLKGENMAKNTLRTFIYKIGDIEADSKIKMILGEGWRLSTVTPNGTVRIATFNRDYISANSCGKMKNVVQYKNAGF